MLFIYFLSLLYFTQLVFSQTPSEAEAINKIINLILVRAEKRNAKADSMDFFPWEEEIASSKKPFKTAKRKLNPFLKNNLSKANPTLKLHDLLPELIKFNTQTVRHTDEYSSADDAQKFKESKENLLTTESFREFTSTATPTYKLSSGDTATVTDTSTAKPNFMIEIRRTKQPVQNDFLDDKVVKHEHMFSQSIFNEPHNTNSKTKSTSLQEIHKSLFDPFDSPTRNVGNDNMVTTSKVKSVNITKVMNNVSGYKKAHTPSYYTITASEWTSLKEIEDLVKSVPNYRSKSSNIVMTKGSPNDFLKKLRHSVVYYSMSSTEVIAFQTAFKKKDTKESHYKTYTKAETPKSTMPTYSPATSNTNDVLLISPKEQLLTSVISLEKVPDKFEYSTEGQREHLQIVNPNNFAASSEHFPASNYKDSLNKHEHIIFESDIPTETVSITQTLEIDPAFHKHEHSIFKSDIRTDLGTTTQTLEINPTYHKHEHLIFESNIPTETVSTTQTFEINPAFQHEHLILGSDNPSESGLTTATPETNPVNIEKAESTEEHLTGKTSYMIEKESNTDFTKSDSWNNEFNMMETNSDAEEKRTDEFDKNTYINRDNNLEDVNSDMFISTDKSDMDDKNFYESRDSEPVSNDIKILNKDTDITNDQSGIKNKDHKESEALKQEAENERQDTETAINNSDSISKDSEIESKDNAITLKEDKFLGNYGEMVSKERESGIKKSHNVVKVSDAIATESNKAKDKSKIADKVSNVASKINSVSAKENKISHKNSNNIDHAVEKNKNLNDNKNDIAGEKLNQANQKAADQTSEADKKAERLPTNLAEKKSNLSDLYNDVKKISETVKEEKEKEGLHKKIAKHFNWESLKRFFGHDRVCHCRCAANHTICKVCAASDAVMRELIFEFNNLANYMNSHCTEIQTFFWTNPTGGKKFRDTVHRVDKTVENYYKRVRGKCRGQTCKTFSTFMDKRQNQDSEKRKRKYIAELLRELEKIDV